MVMDNDFKEFQNEWNNNKNNIELSPNGINTLYDKIKKKEKANYFFYYGTIIILLATLIVISLFFYYVAPVKEILSRIGAGLMICGLIVRIGIEIISIGKAKRMNTIHNTLTATENTIRFHQFRKVIHSIVAPIIVGLYTIGFYMITPEFSLYISRWNLLLIDISYIVIAIILFFVIRKGIKKEMVILSEIMDLRNEITE